MTSSGIKDTLVPFLLEDSSRSSLLIKLPCSNSADADLLSLLDSTLKKEDITKAKSGIMIDKQMFFGKIKNQKKNEFTIEITEGRNRILRRIFEDKLKYKIYMLKRIKIKNLKLGNLKVGEVRELSEDEVNDLKNS